MPVFRHASDPRPYQYVTSHRQKTEPHMYNDSRRFPVQPSNVFHGGVTRTQMFDDDDNVPLSECLKQGTSANHIASASATLGRRSSLPLSNQYHSHHRNPASTHMPQGSRLLNPHQQPRQLPPNKRPSKARANSMVASSLLDDGSDEDDEDFVPIGVLQHQSDHDRSVYRSAAEKFKEKVKSQYQEDIGMTGQQRELGYKTRAVDDDDDDIPLCMVQSPTSLAPKKHASKAADKYPSMKSSDDLGFADSVTQAWDDLLKC